METTNGGKGWQPLILHFDEPDATTVFEKHAQLAAEHPQSWRKVEMFERRGNDWIRTRPHP